MGFISMEKLKQKSPNWDLIDKIDCSLSLSDRVFRAIGFAKKSFPYDEGFPRHPYDIVNARFGLIVPKVDWHGVEEVEGVVDYDSQYTADGLKWVVTKGSCDNRGFIGRHLVIAWYEK
mgnify:CR=1 FL=1